MVAVWWSVGGALVVIAIQLAFALVIRPNEAVHALLSDHEFGPWTDVWRVDQRDFGGQKVGRVLQCFRALVEGVPVELLHEGDQRVRANGRFWSVVAQVPHDLAFTLGSGGATGTVPPGCDDLVAASTDGRLDAVLVCQWVHGRSRPPHQGPRPGPHGAHLLGDRTASRSARRRRATRLTVGVVHQDGVRPQLRSITDEMSEPAVSVW